MLPKWHILLGAIFSLILFFAFKVSLLNSLIVFLASILLDIDHYFLYIFIKQDLNLKRAYNWFQKNKKAWINFPLKNIEKYKTPLWIFHGIELWIILLLLSFINNIFIWVFLGFTFHMIFDFADLIYIKFPLFSKLSPIYVWRRNKNKIILPFSK